MLCGWEGNRRSSIVHRIGRALQIHCSMPSDERTSPIRSGMKYPTATPFHFTLLFHYFDNLIVLEWRTHDVCEAYGDTLVQQRLAFIYR